MSEIKNEIKSEIKLTPKQKEFCKLYLDSSLKYSAADIYRLVYNPNASDDYARRKASEVKNSKNVKAYLDMVDNKLTEDIVQKEIMNKTNLLEDTKNIIDNLKKVYIKNSCVDLKATDKLLKALDVAAKLIGAYSPDKQINNVIRIELGEADEYAD